MKLKTVFDLPSTLTCRRNGEGAFLYNDDGEILYAYSEFHTENSDDGAPSNIVMLRSSDEGETWKYEGLIADASDFGVTNVMCVCPARLLDGAIAFFFLIKETDGTSTLGRTVSHDNGKTFCTERCGFEAEKAYYVLENDRVVRLSDGRLATALSRHDSGFTKATAVTFVSDDDGKNFRSVAECGIYGDRKETSTMEEPGILERPDGSIFLWARTYLGSQYVSESFDGLKTLSAPVPSRFTSPLSPMIVKREASGTCYAVYNPEPTRPGLSNLYARTPLVLEISHDNGYTWGEKAEICPDRAFVYMYPSTFETKQGDLLVSFMYKKVEETKNMNLGMRILKIHF